MSRAGVGIQFQLREHQAIYIPASGLAYWQAMSYGMLSCSAICYRFYRLASDGKPALVGLYLSHIQGPIDSEKTPAYWIKQLGLGADDALTEVSVALETRCFKEDPGACGHLSKIDKDAFASLKKTEQAADVGTYLQTVLDSGVPRSQVKFVRHPTFFTTDIQRAPGWRGAGLTLNLSRLAPQLKRLPGAKLGGYLDLSDATVVQVVASQSQSLARVYSYRLLPMPKLGDGKAMAGVGAGAGSQLAVDTGVLPKRSGWRRWLCCCR
jgi:hypothetical protein